MERLFRMTPVAPSRGSLAPTTREGVSRLLEEARSELSQWERRQAEAEQAALDWEAKARQALAADCEDLAMEAVSAQLKWRDMARQHAVQRRIAAAHVELIESAFCVLAVARADQGSGEGGHQ